MVLFQSRRSLCHLHQGHQPLLHSGAAGSRKDDHRKFFPGGTFYCLGNLFSHIVAHAAHHKPGVADADYSRITSDLSFSGDNGLIQICLFSGCLYLFFISRKIQGIGKFHMLVPFLKGPLIHQHLDPPVCVHPEIPAALGADIVITFYILHINGLSALITLSPESFRNAGLSLLRPVSGINSCISLFKHIPNHAHTSLCLKLFKLIQQCPQKSGHCGYSDNLPPIRRR